MCNVCIKVCIMHNYYIIFVTYNLHMYSELKLFLLYITTCYNMYPLNSSYSCILCNYVVISPHNTCKHNYCDYCLSKISICLFCTYTKLSPHKTCIYNYCDYCLYEANICLFCKMQNTKLQTSVGMNTS